MISSFILKIIACISMIFDHSGYIIFGKFSFFNYIGRLAFPIFAFQISEGYLHTSNLKKYSLRLLYFALISQIPFMLFSYIISAKIFVLNIFFTLLIGLLAIFVYDKIKTKFLGILLVSFFAFFAQIIKVDYGAYGIAIIFLFYLFKNNKLKMALSFVLATIIKFGISIYNNGPFNFYSLLCFFTCLSIVFILFYNNKKGKSTKYFLYFFYPIHLMILCGISLLIL